MTQTTFIKKLAGIFLLALILCQAGYSKPTPEEIKKQTSLLFQAVRGKDVEMAKSCIKEGADVNATDNDGLSVLEVAKLNKADIIVSILKGAGAK